MHYRSFVLAVLLLSLGFACGPDDPAIELAETEFPDQATGDYEPDGYTARVVFPDASRKGKEIWVKGSAAYNKVRLRGSGQWVNLSPPFFTAYLSSTADSTFVEFSGEQAQQEKENGLWVYPVTREDIRANSDFSFNVFGCFQPFDVVDSTKEAVVRVTKEGIDASIRRLFRTISLHQEVQYFVRDKNTQDDLFEFNFNEEQQRAEQVTQPLTSPPKLLLATGDQVYVDAAYTSGGKDNPISGWEIGENPKPRLYPGPFKEHLDRLYRHFYDFTSMEAATARLPVIAAWDDHEIRDGWGSQGDEYPEGKEGFSNIEPHVQPYFLAAREAYLQHQIATGPAPVSPLNNTDGSDLHLELEANGVPIFVFDLRSQRNIQTETVIDSVQMIAFRAWLDRLQSGQEVVIISSVPFFWKTTQLFQEIIKIKPELRDDIADSWDEGHNRPQRNAILAALLKTRVEKDIKPFICSGDIHVGAINEVWYEKKDKAGEEAEPVLLAYELVTSGLSHKGLANQTYAGQLQQLASNEGTFAEDMKVSGYPDHTFDLTVRMLVSAAKLNFANIDHQKEETILNMFLQDEKKLMQIRLPVDWQKAYQHEGLNVGELTDEAQAKTFIAKQSNVEQRVLLDW